MAFDVIFMIAFCWAAYKGYSKGFILQAASLAALILGIYGAVQFSGFTASLLEQKMTVKGEYMPLISFAVTFIAIVVGIHFLAKLSEKLLKMISLNFINRILGTFFNLIKYAFIISGILVIINTINRKIQFIPKEKIQESILYIPLSSLAPMLFPYLHFDVNHPLNVPNKPELEELKDELLV